MKHYKLFLFSLFSFLFSLQYCQAQETINTSGGNASGTEGSVSFSFGQLLVMQQNGPSGSVLPGVQQPFEISKLSSNFNTRVDLSIEIYPNPTADFLIISIDEINQNNHTYQYQIMDIAGNVIISRALLMEKTEIDMTEFQHSVFLISVNDEMNNSKTFKIIKK